MKADSRETRHKAEWPRHEMDASEQLNLDGEPGSEVWRGQFVAQVHQIVSNTFSHQLPPKLQPVFSVDDLAQEASMRLFEHVASRPDMEIRSGFVVVVARRVLIDQVRRHLAQKRSPDSGFIDVSPSSSTNLLNDISERTRTPSRLEMNKEFWTTAMSLLTARERELVELKYNEQLTNDEIGQLLGKSGQAVRSLLYRTHSKLKDELSHRTEFESFFS